MSEITRERLNDVLARLDDRLADGSDPTTGELQATVAAAAARLGEYLTLAEEGHTPQALRVARVVAEGWWQVLESADRWAQGSGRCVLAA